MLTQNLVQPGCPRALGTDNKKVWAAGRIDCAHRDLRSQQSRGFAPNSYQRGSASAGLEPYAVSNRQDLVEIVQGFSLCQLFEEHNDGDRGLAAVASITHGTSSQRRLTDCFHVEN